MSKSETKDLKKFLKPFPPDLQARALWLREFIWDLFPTANELIYDNYNALAVGWSLTEKQGQTFCTLALGRSSYRLHCGFYRGNELADPKGLLLGEGNQYRYFLVNEVADFPKAYATQLMKEAYDTAVAKAKGPSTSQGKTYMKSISPVKRAAAKKAAPKKKKAAGKSSKARK